MSTSGGINTPAPAAQDFWRSSNGTTKPDGTADTTDFIMHNGAVAIGGFSLDPVAMLDVSSGGRTGTDGRVAGVTPFYATGNVPGMPASGTLGLPTPTGGSEFRHNNQSQGIGFAFNGLYATGSSASQDFGLLSKGTGLHFKGWQTPNGSLYYDDAYGGAVPAANVGFVERYYMGGTYLGAFYPQYAETVGPLSTRQQWDITLNGTSTPGMRLRPVNDGVRTAGAELYIDENRINKRKLVLFDNGAAPDTFFGFGIQSSTLAYNVPSLSQQHSFWFGAVERVNFDSSGIYITTGIVIPAAAPTDVGLFYNPTTGRFTKGANAKKRKFAATGVTDAAGVVTFNITAAGFTAAPVANISIETPVSNNVYDLKITAKSATSISVKVTKAIPVTILSISVLAQTVNAAGETIDLICMEAGAE